MAGVRVLASATAVALVVAVLAASGVSAAVRGGGSAAVGSYIVVLKPSADQAAAVAKARALGGDVFMQYRHALNGFAVRLPEEAVSGVERNPNVLFVSPDEPVQATASCDPTAVQCLPTGIDRIDADRSSARSGDGRGSVNVNIAIVDSGIDTAHPDLNVVGGVDCQQPSSGIDDTFGHGTHVAGIAAARDNGIGVVGAAPGARLWSVRVLDDRGSGSVTKTICGIDWVTSTRQDADPTNDIAVANLSLGGKGSDDGNCGLSNHDAEHLAICNSVAAGVTYVLSAGNDGVDFQAQTPAAYDEVLTVTATTDFDGQPGGAAANTCLPQFPFVDDAAAFFSDFATLPSDQAHTIAAPGVCILSTLDPDANTQPGSMYFTASGTSMSAPHVAGTVALCIASGPCAGLTPAQIIQKIISDAAAYNTKHPGYGFQGDPLRPVNGKYYGYLINATNY